MVPLIQSSRWNFDEMREDAIRRGVTPFRLKDGQGTLPGQRSPGA
jgi:hypothetical protein